MAKKKAAKVTLFSLVLPGLLVMAWVFALMGSQAPGSMAGDSTNVNTLRWMLYFCSWNFLISSVMHSVFAHKTASSIGWKTNGFQYELAAVSLGIGLACLYAYQHSLEAWVAAAIPVVAFLFLAGLNHVKEIVREKNYAANNTMILIWDFGMPISLLVLLLPMVR